jgi:hypothetical protein
MILTNPDGKNERVFNTDRIRLAVSKLVQASELSGDKFNLDWLKTGTDDFQDKVKFWDYLCNEAMKSVGKVTVRFLGDLKESTYPLSVKFFQAKGDDESDFIGILRKTITEASGERKITFVNLANVREISVDIGNIKIPGLQDDIAFLLNFLEYTRNWKQVVVKEQ